jgi:hypothetical protein
MFVTPRPVPGARAASGGRADALPTRLTRRAGRAVRGRARAADQPGGQGK